MCHPSRVRGQSAFSTSVKVQRLLKLHMSLSEGPQGGSDRHQDVYCWQLQLLLSQSGDLDLRDCSFTVETFSGDGSALKTRRVPLLATLEGLLIALSVLYPDSVLLPG